MAKTVNVPEYLLASVLRHYKALAAANIGHDDLRAFNAKRVAPKEIARMERLISTQTNGTDSHIQ